jgi:DNA-binding GntR family transcriptional regulator
LRQGQRLVERQLAAEFQASLGAVREALIELEAQGFILKKTNFATYVIEFTATTIDKLYKFREVVETFAVEEAARIATPGQIESLEKLYLQLLDAGRSGDAREFIQKDLALHELIWKIADNEHFVRALERVVKPWFAFTAARVASTTALQLVQDANLHLSFVQPIKSHNPVVARAAFLAALEEWRRFSKSSETGLVSEPPEITGP